MDSQHYINHINILKKQIEDLTFENNVLNTRIKHLQDLFSYDICRFYNKHKSIRKTSDYFYFDNVKECYYKLIEYYDSPELIDEAVDYLECYSEIFENI